MTRISLFEPLLVLVLAFGIFSHRIGEATLIDPWETHYGEVGRRILADDDWVRLSWEQEGFRSKPALTPWLIALSLKLHGIAADGGYSGELATDPHATRAVRLPFCFFGALGITFLFYLAARLRGRRLAWLAAAVLTGTPFWFFVARQAITDMPMAATALGAFVCFLLAVEGPAPAIRRRRLTVFWLAIAVWVAPQLVVFGHDLYAGAPLGVGIRVPAPTLVLVLPFIGLLGLLLGLALRRPTRRDLYLYGMYALGGLSILGKGPPGVALVALSGVLYLGFTGRLRWIPRLRIATGIVIVLLVAGPWHVAMSLRDGVPFITEYFGQHWLRRATGGVHEANLEQSETFRYFLEQLAIGFGPFLLLIPIAFAGALQVRGASTSSDRLRLAAFLYAATGVALFTLVETKFHHYVLPAVPGFALLVAMSLEDTLTGRRPKWLLVGLGAACTAVVAASIVHAPDQLIELFTYRYDRPWPEDVPVGGWVSLGLGAAFIGACLLRTRWRAWGVGAVLVVGLTGAVSFAPGYMSRAAPHWGQRDLVRAYYDARRVHGAHLRYGGRRALFDDVSGGSRTVRVPLAVPASLREGDEFRLAVEVHDRKAHVIGRVHRLHDDGVDVQLPEDLAALAPLVEGAAECERFDGDAPEITVLADRLIAWQLYWRGETFWTGDEINGPLPDMRSELRSPGAEPLRSYLRHHGNKSETLFVLTERHRLPALRQTLPAHLRESVRVLDESSNKFMLAAFSPRSGRGAAP